MKNLLLSLLVPLFLAPAAHGVITIKLNGLFLQEHPAQNEKALLVMSHGLLSHSKGYLPFVKKLNSQGYTVYIHDLRGHGESKGKRGHIDNFDTYLQDFEYVIRMVKSLNSKSPKPLYLFGHSMGGLISLAHSVDPNYTHDIAGLILSAPAIHISTTTIQDIKLFFAEIFKSVRPTMPAILEDIAPETLTDEPSALAELHADLSKKNPLRGSGYSIKLATEIMRASDIAKSYASKENLSLPPLLIIQGQKDSLVDPEKNIKYADLVKDKVRGPLRTLLYANTLHEPLRATKPTKDSVENEIIRFMDELQ